MITFKKFLKFAEKRMPEFLTATGLVLNGVSVVEAIRNTPRALDELRSAEEEKGEELTTKEKIEAAWKCYIPTMVTGVLGAGCIIGGAVGFRKQNAALVSLYAISEGALSEYKKKMIQELGETKVKEIEQKMDQEVVNKLALPGDDDEESPNTALSLRRRDICLDTWINKPFYASEIEIREAVNELNDEINHGDFVSLNDFYFKIGQDPVDFGGEIGWDSDIGLIDVRISSCVKDGRPILTMTFKNTPKSTPYHRFY